MAGQSAGEHRSKPRAEPKREVKPLQSAHELLLRHRSSIFAADIERLAALKADILLTHEAPSCHPQGFAVIDTLAQGLGVQRVFHGHHHDRRDYRLHEARLGFEVFGVGFCGISALDGFSLVPGLFDATPHRGHACPPLLLPNGPMPDE